MAKNKRLLEPDTAADLDGAHPDRRKRVKYTEADAQLASIYNELADDVLIVRVKAAGELLKTLSVPSDHRNQRLDAAETRLIKGLCSGRKAARLGFSIALAEVFRLRFQLQKVAVETVKLTVSIDKILKLTEAQGNVSGQERRDYLLGRRFAFQAILHSDVGLSYELDDAEWQSFIEAFFDLASHKQWLRRECGLVLYDYLVSPNGAKLPDDRVKNVVSTAQEHKFLKTPEGVGLWATVTNVFPNAKMPKDVWHHCNPLSSKERSTLSKVMLENSVQDEDVKTKAGARQITPSFAWKVVLNELYKEENIKAFKHFWEETVVNGMFSTSTSAERRSLGLQVCSLALATAPVAYLPQVLHRNVVQCILDQRAEPNRVLFDAAKVPLNQVVGRAKAEPAVASVVSCELIKRRLLNFDQATKTKTIEGIVHSADDESLRVITEAIKSSLESLVSEQIAATDQRVKALADFTLALVRQRKDTGIASLSDGDKGSPTPWLGTALRYMASISYDPRHLPGDKALLRSRLMSCLNALLGCPLVQALPAIMVVVRKCLSFGASGDEQADLTSRADEHMKRAYDRQDEDAGSRAFTLLFALSVIQVYNEEPDAAAALEDLITCYEARNEEGDSLTMLVELLLSFISKPSALFRKLAEQAFSAFAADLTADSLQSLLDILDQKESLSGQNELFDQDGEGAEDASIHSDDDDAVDIEDASDVELVNGKEANGSDSEAEASDDTSGSEADAGADGAEDEEAAFDKKLAEALGTSGMNNDADSSDDGSDMDDEQMMALEPHLTTIFQERRKTTSRKQDKKDAKETIVNFKNRVLDLLTTFVKGQHANVLALDLILPVLVLARTTTNKATAEKAFAVLKLYFDTCNKHKSLPRPADAELVFAVLAAVHEEMKLGGSKLHANACSRSSLFLSKVLVGLERGYYDRIAGMYAKLQAEWWMQPGSKVPGSVFTEWTSWSIGTRKSG